MDTYPFTVGILGGGQLGKMSLMAAQQLGLSTAVWAPRGDNPAAALSAIYFDADFTDEATLDAMRKASSVITTEWENIPLELITKLEARGAIVRPGSYLLGVAQSRVKEKQLAHTLGIPTTAIAWLPRVGAWSETWRDCLPGILKTNTHGYDGQGQWSVDSAEELASTHQLAGVDCILEKRITLSHELSVLVARNNSGEIAVSDVVHNTHDHGILSQTVWPIPSNYADSEAHADYIQTSASRVARHLKLEGVLCLEFIVADNRTVLFNEMAPRPHNSFHGSIEAAYTSQFEQHIRAISDLPLGRVEFHTPFTSYNLLGGSWEAWSTALSNPNARLHVYGKKASKPGRKMGHVTVLH